MIWIHVWPTGANKLQFQCLQSVSGAGSTGNLSCCVACDYANGSLDARSTTHLHMCAVSVWPSKDLNVLAESLILMFFIIRLHSAAPAQAVTACVLFHQLHRSYGSSGTWRGGVHISAHVWKAACWTPVAIFAAKVETVLSLPGSDRGTPNSG